MVGISVHTQSPINPNKGSRPEAVPSSPSTNPSERNHTSTLPVPAAVTLPSTDSQPPSPSPNRSVAAPLLSSTGARHPSIPPPPKVGEIPKPAAYYAPQYDAHPTTLTNDQSPPFNTSLPPPSTSRTSRSPLQTSPGTQPTYTTRPATSSLPPPADRSHPPGYVQNSRTSFSENAFPADSASRPSSSHISPGGRSRGRSMTGILDGGGGGGGHENVQGPGDREVGMWDTAWSWAKMVGDKVVEGEEEVWKRINGVK